MLCFEGRGARIGELWCQGTKKSSQRKAVRPKVPSGSLGEMVGEINEEIISCK